MKIYQRKFNDLGYYIKQCNINHFKTIPSISEGSYIYDNEGRRYRVINCKQNVDAGTEPEILIDTF